jgi:membrane protein
MPIRRLLHLLRHTYQAWRDDGGVRMAAALAYYALFCLAPLAVIGVAIAGGLLSNPAIAGRLVEAARSVIGPVGAEALEGIIAQAPLDRDEGIAATALSLVAVMLGTLGLFQHLKGALNFIWKVAPYRPTTLRSIIWRQFLMFVTVGLVGLALIVSIIATAIIAAVTGYVRGLTPEIPAAWSAVNLLVTFGIVALLVAVIYQAVPDAEVAWRDVWAGAIFTSALLVLGQYAIGLYLRYVGIGSAFGAAGSFVVLLIWVHLSAQIFLIGAEFTYTYAQHAGRPIQPGHHAVQMIRQTIVERQKTLDAMEREFEVEIARIREEAETMKVRAEAGEPSVPAKQRALQRAASVSTYVVSFATGLILGILGVKRRVI